MRARRRIRARLNVTGESGPRIGYKGTTNLKNRIQPDNESISVKKRRGIGKKETTTDIL